MIVPAEYVELNAPPFGCDGGCSSVVPSTVTLQGGAPGKHVPLSFIPDTTIWLDVLVRKSANPLGAGKVLMSITLKRRRVTGPPVLFCMRRLISSVPKVELFAGSDVKSLTRFGGPEAA